MEIFVIIWIGCALLGALVGQSKGRAGAGFALGLLLGLIGVLITALLSKTPEKQAADLAVMRAALGTPTALPLSRWCADPIGHHQYRWWDGARWTEHVSDNGQQSIDSAPPASART